MYTHSNTPAHIPSHALYLMYVKSIKTNKARKREKEIYFFGPSAFDEKWICLLADVENIILGKTNRVLT